MKARALFYVPALAALVAPLAALSAPIMGVVEGDLARIDLYAEQGLCVGYARRAVFVPKDGRPEVSGCWRVVSTEKGPALSIAFLDGEFFETSALRIKPPAGV